MELRPYYDRPTGQIKNYLSLIEQKVSSNFPHWGRVTKEHGRKATTVRVSSVRINSRSSEPTANG